MKICLCLMVKNGLPALVNTIQSWLPVIDYYVVLDTGSTDPTMTVLKSLLHNVPGELHERPFDDFATSRNHLLSLAQGKGDYLFTPDADELLLNPEGIRKQLVEACDQFMIRFDGPLDWTRPMFLRGDLPWKYYGVCHEYITRSDNLPLDIGLLKEASMFHLGSGDYTEKNRRNLNLLLDGIKQEPSNSRYKFYLAQTCFEAQDYKSAAYWYAKRVLDNGWDQELFWSLYRLAQCYMELGEEGEAIHGLLLAYNFRPNRAEPLYRLAKWYREHNHYHAAYVFSKQMMEAEYPTDILFVERATYEYERYLEHGLCAYWTGRYEEARAANQQVLTSQAPALWLDTARTNIQFCNQAISQQIAEKRQSLDHVASQVG